MPYIILMYYTSMHLCTLKEEKRRLAALKKARRTIKEAVLAQGTLCMYACVRIHM